MDGAHLAAAPVRLAPYRPLLLAAAMLSLCVVGLGAYVRLTDAGLGCPDWPGCHGHLVPEQAADAGRAWREMIHRYAAGTLGLLIFALAGAAWRRPRRGLPRLETALAGLVVAQALLGMWTVTGLLAPAIVTAHLLGGMLTWTLLVVLVRREFAAPGPAIGGRYGHWTLAVLLGQVALGGWVSSHYAGLACPDFPTCLGSWWPTAPPAWLHWLHRLGALAVLAVAGGYAAALLRRPAARAFGLAVALALAMQLALGIGNVLLRLPLPLAVAHNLGAAILLATVAATIVRRPPWPR
ncbi:MAG TPA: COX15/CtaA family protein [Rhodocyclaceae bacterium]|nr:COX15/CtaA family protein [Rhodocyclaceae bacterium]